mmetsp:Transcript_5518/g.6356  ORF Transcript_5518/g.6356 Transcript_5518/m.6356 type:complete len:148 (-) Transcript_5518:65-508(-)
MDYSIHDGRFALFVFGSNDGSPIGCHPHNKNSDTVSAAAKIVHIIGIVRHQEYSGVGRKNNVHSSNSSRGNKNKRSFIIVAVIVIVFYGFAVFASSSTGNDCHFHSKKQQLQQDHSASLLFSLYSLVCFASSRGMMSRTIPQQQQHQ